MMMERENIIETKKKYFFSSYEQKQNHTKPKAEETTKQPSSPSNIDHSELRSPLDTPTHSKSPTSPTHSLRETGKNSSQVKKIRNLYFELEQMRLKSERDRISTYREMVEALIHNSTTGVIKK